MIGKFEKLQDYIFPFLKGVCMGGVEVLNGVSGGTVAFTTGIYDQWVHSLAAIDYEALQLIKRRRFNDFWKKNKRPLSYPGAG